MHQNLDAGDDLGRAVAHGAVVSGDIGLALGTVDDQRVQLLLRPCLELDRGREPGAAEPADTGLADQLQQGDRLQCAEIGNGLQVAPAVLAVSLDVDSPFLKTRCVRVGRRANGRDRAGGRRVHGTTDHAAGLGDHLAFEYRIANCHAGLSTTAQVLLQGHDQAAGNRRRLNAVAKGLGLVLGRVNATGNVPNADRGSGSHQAAPRLASVAIRAALGSGKSHFQLCGVVGSGSMSIQSTGQGSTHRSQPVHSSVMTVCICLAAPRMASTGQAWMHLVQPMHSASRI